MQDKIVVDTAAVVLGSGLGTRVAIERNGLGIVDWLSNQRSRSRVRSQNRRTETRKESHKHHGGC